MIQPSHARPKLNQTEPNRTEHDLDLIRQICQGEEPFQYFLSSRSSSESTCKLKYSSRCQPIKKTKKVIQRDPFTREWQPKAGGDVVKEEHRLLRQPSSPPTPYLQILFPSSSKKQKNVNFKNQLPPSQSWCANFISFHFFFNRISRWIICISRVSFFFFCFFGVKIV